jgi:hypothetical protein
VLIVAAVTMSEQSMLVSLVDEVPGQFREARGSIAIGTPAITVRALIRARLELELERLRDMAAERRMASWLAMPCETSPPRTGGEYPMQSELEAMVAVALAGFERGRFFVLVNDRQVTLLDEVVPLASATEVTFLRLMPLQGG